MNNIESVALKYLNYPEPFPKTKTFKEIKELMAKIQTHENNEVVREFRLQFNQRYKDWELNELGKPTFARKYAYPVVMEFGQKLRGS